MSRIERFLLIGILIVAPLRWFDMQDETANRQPDSWLSSLNETRKMARLLRADAINVLAGESVLVELNQRCGMTATEAMTHWRQRNSTILAAAKQVLAQGGGMSARERGLLKSQAEQINQGIHGSQRPGSICAGMSEMLSRGLLDFERTSAHREAALRLKKATGR